MENEEFSLGIEMQKECLWFCFSAVIRQDLNFVKEHWNTLATTVRIKFFDNLFNDIPWNLSDHTDDKTLKNCENPGTEIEQGVNHT